MLCILVWRNVLFACAKVRLQDFDEKDAMQDVDQQNIIPIRLVESDREGSSEMTRRKDTPQLEIAGGAVM